MYLSLRVNWFRALGYRLCATSSRLDTLRDKLTIQQAKTRKDFKFVTRLCSKKNWHGIGAHTVSHMGSVIKPGILIGWLNGQRVGCVSACKFGNADDGLVSFGLYLVEESFRGRGIGLQLTDAWFESVGKGWNIAVNSNRELLTQKYGSFFGINEKLLLKDYTVPCSRIIATLQRPEPDLFRNVAIKPIDQVDFAKLSVYDTSVFGFPRREFLKRWITIPQSTGFVATNDNGDIVGYGVMQSALINNKEQIIGPLFSDNESITRSLLYTLAKAAIDPQMGGADVMTLTVPMENNSGVTNLIENEIGCNYFPDLTRMYTKGIPPSQALAVGRTKVVAVTSQAFG